ncbi:hypothetical protein [Solitalea lacus]|uniref:hypothetical protein n=1 Tax=Solitalea lacus TaxID=2911172 RepID=UPI001EDBEBFD|nr:hypothetical protein [Solitalea lacus]UKJ07243.1 hypothetical protein L2B55_17160 [Solitalea lacus]
MKTNLIAIATIAFAFTACNDNDDVKPEAEVPQGSWKLKALHHFDKTGKDSAITNLPNSTVLISFDKANNLAAFNGKPEQVIINGSYKMEGDYKLVPGTVSSDKSAASEGDIKTIDFLKTGYKYDVKKDSIIIYAKNKGYMVYSAVNPLK